MKTKTHFAFRIDVWDGDGNNIVEHLAGLDNHAMAVAAYWAALGEKTKKKNTPRPSARGGVKRLGGKTTPQVPKTSPPGRGQRRRSAKHGPEACYIEGVSGQVH